VPDMQGWRVSKKKKRNPKKDSHGQACGLTAESFQWRCKRLKFQDTFGDLHVMEPAGLGTGPEL